MIAVRTAALQHGACHPRSAGSDTRAETLRPAPCAAFPPPGKPCGPFDDKKMQLSRLIQPRNPLFWLLLMLNLLSAVISHLLHTRDLPVLLRGGLGMFALANLLIGLWIGWRLLASPPRSDTISASPPTTDADACPPQSCSRH